MTRYPLAASSLLALAAALPLAACGGGGGGGGTPPPVDPAQSSLTATPAFGTRANGTETAGLRVQLFDANGLPLRGRTVVLEATGFANALTQPARTDATGAATGALATTVGEVKSVTAVIDPGPDEIRLGPVPVEFLRILPNWRFVRTSGSDANDGTSPLTAWATLGHALTQVGPGQVLFVGAGTYFDPLVIDTAATADMPLVIRGDRTGEFTGDAGEVLLDVGAAPTGIELQGASFVTLRGLSVRNSDNAGLQGGAIWVNGASSCSILDCRLYENRRALMLDGSSDTRVEDCRISANTGNAIQIANATRPSIVDNLIYANDGRGILLATVSSDVSIQYNTLYRNAGDQIYENTPGSTGTISNNVLSESTGMGLGLSAGTALGSNANLTWLNTSNSPAPTVTADPLLVDPAGPDGVLGGAGMEDDDFRMGVTSPALDAGSDQAQQVTTALSVSLATRGTRTDDVLDGEAPDLANSNLGFHYPTSLETTTSLAASGARVAFAGSGDAVVDTRAWDAAGDTWNAPVRTHALGRDVRYLVQRTSPGPKPEEILAAQIDTGDGAWIVVRTWDARRWSDDAPAVLSQAIDPANADERGFDVEYESDSGRAMLVTVDGGTNVLYRILEEGVWSAPLPVFTPPVMTGTVLWTELEPHAGSNRLALVALGANQNLAATVWDGTQWTHTTLLATQVNSVRDFRAFDVAWETLSGDVLVSWGHSQFAEETRYATLGSTTGLWTTGQFVNTDTVGMTVHLAGDPISNRIIGIFGEGFSDDDVGVSVWRGQTWTDTAELALQGHPQSRAMDVGWFGTTGIGFALYRDQATTGVFQWALLNGGGWRRQAEVFLPGVGRLVQCENRIIPGTNRVMLTLLDENGSLWAIEHDGTAWVLRNDDLPLATGLDPTNPGRAFDFDLRSL